MSLVERAGVGIDRVDQQDGDADRLERVEGAQHGVTQQPGTDPASVDGSVDGQSCEQRGRDGMARHAPGSALSRLIVRDRCGAQRVVPHDPCLIGDDDEGSRRTRGGRPDRVLREPEVQRRDAAIESLDVVVRGERFGVAEARHLLGSAPAHQRDDVRLDRRGTVEGVAERLPGVLIEHEVGAVGQDHSRRARGRSRPGTPRPTCRRRRPDGTAGRRWARRGDIEANNVDVISQ